MRWWVGWYHFSCSFVWLKQSFVADCWWFRVQCSHFVLGFLAFWARQFTFRWQTVQSLSSYFFSSPYSFDDLCHSTFAFCFVFVFVFPYFWTITFVHRVQHYLRLISTGKNSITWENLFWKSTELIVLCLCNQQFCVGFDSYLRFLSHPLGKTFPSKIGRSYKSSKIIRSTIFVIWKNVLIFAIRFTPPTSNKPNPNQDVFWKRIIYLKLYSWTTKTFKLCQQFAEHKKINVGTEEC